MDKPPWWAAGVDLNKPSSARVYDVHLGGSHNFEVDREVAEAASRLMPTLPAVLRANRSFLRRAVRYLAGQGITQFLDLGSGIPTVGNVHEIAQRENPECRIVYVDNDLIAVAHSRSLLEGNDRAEAVRADLRHPDEVLGHPDVAAMLDLRQPIAVLMFAVLHFVADEDEPAAIVGRYVEAIAPGSYVAISHACNDHVDESTLQAAELYSRRIGGFHMRPAERIAEFFAGLSLVEPGLVDLTEWRPDSPEQQPRDEKLWTGPGGVGRKP
ncbi:SAM-dependent methyltransferase [Saccharopolyspora erythraea]|uniref:SAM-dependent methyltransferase n=1 Tax=Saccharopolyspora erythraea TaxID=1836 RepID=UPI001BA508C4|nr:SAM-dependent methyltransferase [Saccharopolyspora erythraea]QUH03200.1 SAM-dependent methyltransferase [Saccharopolyspora erythraea]